MVVSSWYLISNLLSSDADLQRALCHGPRAVMALSAVCGVLLLVSVTVSMLCEFRLQHVN